MKSNAWSKKDEQFLRDNYLEMSNPDLASAVGRSVNAVKSRLTVLKLKRPKDLVIKFRMANNPNRWTKRERLFVVNNMHKMTNPQMAEKLERSISSVENLICSLAKRGIRRSEKTRKKMMSLGWFEKGNQPWTKGKKGLRLSKATEFKKGHRPANEARNGEIRLRQKKDGSSRYYFIRLGKMKWEKYHRYLWKQHHGDIPAGHLVAFKNGDPLDVRIENLELITKAENVRRNANYDTDHYIAHCIAPRDPELKEELKKYPEILDVKRAQLKLRRAIRDVSTHPEN